MENRIISNSYFCINCKEIYQDYELVDLKDNSIEKITYHDFSKTKDIKQNVMIESVIKVCPFCYSSNLEKLVSLKKIIEKENIPVFILEKKKTIFYRFIYWLIIMITFPFSSAYLLSKFLTKSYIKKRYSEYYKFKYPNVKKIVRKHPILKLYKTMILIIGVFFTIGFTMCFTQNILFVLINCLLFTMIINLVL